MTGPALSFRRIPPAIYVALGVSVAGTIALTSALLRAAGEPYERYREIERWFMLDGGCDVAYAVLLALGLLELAKRQSGAPRLLTRAAAFLGLASLGWLGLKLVLVFVEPGGEAMRLTHEWFRRAVGGLLLASTVLLTFGADSWRRVPIAAAALVVLGFTGHWVPGIGPAITRLIGEDPTWQQLYWNARIALQVAALLFVAAALAASAREPVPEPRTAAASFRLARAMLMLQLVAAVLIPMIVLGGRSPGAAKLVMFGGPAIAFLTMLVFAIALQRVASAGLAGMPRLLLSLGAALTLWWAAVRFEQISFLVRAIKDRYSAEHAAEAAQWFSIAGPIVATLGLALVGSAIGAFARSRGATELRDIATNSTVAFLATTLVSIAVQAQLDEATTRNSALAMLVFAAILVVVGLVVLMGLLARAAASLEAEPGIPPARVV